VTVSDDVVRIGALARHAQVERDADAAIAQPLLREALRQVAHPVVRNRGTTVGSIVHADPAAEMPAVLALLGGEVEVASSTGHRSIAAADLFLGPLESSLRPDEVAIEARVPVAGPRSGSAFVEVARRHGDYAVCGVGVVIAAAPNGTVQTARAAYVSVASTPQLVELTDVLQGAPLDSGDWSAVDALVHDRVRPDGDIHATADYRRHLAVVLTRQALRTAAARAQQGQVAA
jgi:carbon-monoxide dehydrogenase medium subunit